MTRKRVGSHFRGDVGYIIANVKDVHDTKVGDTITHADNLRPAAPWVQRGEADVFSGMYPSNSRCIR